ncbi:hypothetical protein CMI38_07040 [Candidatus Pacearchaeota archaeon]|nr:hypothetical protein [Candidatus Pacearchaeota archaeon]
MAMAMLVMSILPLVFANDVGVGLTPSIGTEDYAPNVWMCDSRLVQDDNTEPGRLTLPGDRLTERQNNYLFEGEQLSYKVLVKEKNGIQKISDVFGTLGDVQGVGNDIEVNCIEDLSTTYVLDSCNARILEEQITDFDATTMRYYDCTFTVETPDSHYGEYWFTVEAEDLDGLSTTVDENEYWFLNPVIAITVEGDLAFEDVRPGTSSYSETLLVGNDADDGSGVLLDMFISGTDFYDTASSGAACPTTNQLALTNFRYYATGGAYSSQDDARGDLESYVPIGYATGFNNPTPFYDGFEIIQTTVGDYSDGNVLTPGSELAITFRLNLPEPCNGDFDSGTINFWGEAI